jgi:hypothetical protein
LYDLLNAGKVVYIDVSATWCGPCWNYHNSHAFRDIWEQRGPDGTDEVFCFFIEGDAATNTACLYGPAGCVGGTQGDWVTGTPYPIIDDASIAGLYQIGYYPTIFCVCPADKKVYEAGQIGATALWNFAQTHCAPPPVTYALESVRKVKCLGTNTGAINITPGGGVGNFTYLWSNGATTQDLNNIPAGTYTVTIYSGSESVVSDPIEVEQPGEPLQGELVEEQLVGCNGVTGSITVGGTGGWGNYTYQWQGGQTGETVAGLGAGTYRVSITDEEGCQIVFTHTLAPAVYPITQIATPGMITCAQPTVTLNALGSDSGDDFTIQWFASNGGNIVSGNNTLTPVVDAAGSYTLQIANIFTTCVSFKSTMVQADLAAPMADAGAPGVVSCPVPNDTLSGSASSGNAFSYNWTGPNVVANGTTLTPVVGAPGTYTLAVTNSGNGCTSTSATQVTGFNTPPSINTSNGVLTCIANNVTLGTSTNSSNPTFAWTGPNGFTSNLQSPTVGNSGSYNVVVNDTITGCSNNATATVTSNTGTPGATASGDALTCVVTMANVAGTTPDTNATFAWTGPNGFTSNLSNFTVNVEGAYNLVVTDPDNGCTSAAVANVISNTTPPTASATAPGNLNCNTTQLQLNGTGSSQGSNISYAWTTTDGHIVSGESTQTPLVDAIGTYTLLVSNSANGCTNTANAQVNQSPVVSGSISSQNNVACFNGTTGAATAAGNGGNGTFTYAWSNGETSASISNLIAGVYVAVITDGEGCTASTTATITQPDQLLANATTTGQTMNGVNDGTATAAPTGGTATYSYAWSNGETTQNISGLAPGSYTVSVTDLNGCVAVQTVNVNSFNCNLSASISGDNVTCFGANNGAAEVSQTGGVEPLTYLWSNGATTSSISGIGGGLFTVNILDANNCPASLDINIFEPTQVNVNASATGETSAGANDGSASANPTGGTGTYTYLWNTGATTQSISGLAPGTYTVEVSDQNACISTQTVVVSSFACAITSNSSILNVTCAGASNGSVTVSLVGGEAPFNFAWSNGDGSATISNLAAGTYTATITDANDCQLVETAVVTEPLPYSDWDIQVGNPACPDDATGSAVAAITGGTMPYNYVWNTGATGSTLSNVIAGNYSVQVTDANGCTSSSAVTINSNDGEAPSASAAAATVALDPSGNVSITLATINAQYSDNCGVASAIVSPSSFSCEQLGAQTVTLTVTDLAGLVTSTTTVVTVTDSEAPVVTCPSNMVVCAYENFVNYQPAVAEDNCLILNGQWNQTSGLPSPSEFPVGTTTQTFTFTDASGNIGTCSFNVTVTPAISFTNVGISNDVNGLGVGAINISFEGGVGPYSFEWSSQNGDVFATTEDVTGLQAGTYQVAITDAQGCKYSYSGIVVTNSVGTKEPEWLSGVQMQPNPTSGLTTIIFVEPINDKLEISVIDATGRVLKSQYSQQAKAITLDCNDLSSGMYTIRMRSNSEVGTRKLMVIK